MVKQSNSADQCMHDRNQDCCIPFQNHMFWSSPGFCATQASQKCESLSWYVRVAARGVLKVTCWGGWPGGVLVKVPTATMFSGSGSRPCCGPKLRLVRRASTGPLSTGVTLVTRSPTFCGGPAQNLHFGYGVWTDTHRRTGRQSDRQTDTQANRQTDRYTGEQTDRQTDLAVSHCCNRRHILTLSQVKLDAIQLLSNPSITMQSWLIVGINTLLIRVTDLLVYC